MDKIQKNKRLTQVILGACAAEMIHRSAHDCNGFALKGVTTLQSRHPVNGVLQNYRYRIVEFWRSY